ncbi:MAG: hypothetical protein WBW76_00445 [Candidatus Cybelea sp.]
MVFLWRTPIAVAAAGLLAACAQSGPPSLMPSAAQNQAPPAGHAAPAFGQAPARHNRGRILYIADIDGQPGLGQIHVYTQGAGRPFGLWVDSKNVLYVANESNKLPASVTEFKPGASSPFFTISDVMGQPGSVAVDRAGNVYVNENVQDEGWVQVFAPGQITPERRSTPASAATLSIRAAWRSILKATLSSPSGRERTDDDDRLRVLRAGDGSQQIIGIGTLRILSIGGPIAADVNE